MITLPKTTRCVWWTCSSMNSSWGCLGSTASILRRRAGRRWLLKIYIYGYLNRIQSSRRLEREAQRNVELMWLIGRLAPDFKAIADFHHDNGKAIRKVAACRRRIASGSFLLSVAMSATAQQDSAPVVRLEKVEVTGSHILRSEIESALPVQVITREDIERSGSTTVAELMSKVSANVLGFNDQLTIGQAGRPGLSSVNLRGIGDGSTLVLLNGRRVANYAFDGGAVDVNSIPLSAVDRVEILKDGASAIYGADAIAGVVNFILRKDFQGFEITGYGSWTQHGGGDQQQAIVTLGYGDLTKDKYNVFVTASYQKDDALSATARPFSRTSYLPDAGINNLSPVAFPANIFASGLFYNPTYATGCTPPTSLPTTFTFIPGGACGFDAATLIDIIPAVERTGVVARATFQLNADHQLFAEAVYTRNNFNVKIAPTPASQFSTPNLDPLLYPAGGPYYPTDFAAANGISGDLNVFYRTVPLGPRVDEVGTSAWRAVVGADGTVGGWNYGTALSYSQTDQSDRFTSGYVSAQRLIDAMATGLINPFGNSGPEGNALLASTQVTGETHSAKGATLEFDARASKEVYALAAGPLAIAVGAEARREKLDNRFTTVITSGDLVGNQFTLQPVSGSRSVEALYVEASVPLAQGFEAQLAARYDHYSDFGGTVNPKVALRWQPVKTILLRTSWGTGFRAPTLYDLYTPQQRMFVFPAQSDPERCPVTGAPTDCDVNFQAVFGGNPNLQPETSQQFNAGVAWEPVNGLSLTIDYWKIDKNNVVGALDATTVFDNFSFYGSTHIIRGPVDPAHPNLPGPIQTIVVVNQNLGNLRTSGIDVDVNLRGQATSTGRFSFALNGTYVIDWKMQPDGLTYVSAVGRNDLAVPGPRPRWKHYAALGWDYGPWSATLGETYQSGYEDTNSFDPDLPAPPPRRVSSYEVWDLQGRYTGLTNMTIVLGIKNLMDRAPPFTNQPFSFQVGYDPAYADPRGRTFYARVTYAFR